MCMDTTRDQHTICVVEEPLDVLAIQRTGVYRGLFHVLHGHIAPLEGVYRENLKIDELIARVRTESVEEVIIATNPNTEGEATAYLLLKDLAPLGVRVTRLARGLPTGGRPGVGRYGYTRVGAGRAAGIVRQVHVACLSSE